MSEYLYTADSVTKIEGYLDGFLPEGAEEMDWHESLRQGGYNHAFDLGEDSAFLQITLYLAADPADSRFYGFAEINYADSGLAYFMFETPIDSLDFLRKYAPTARLINKMEDEQAAIHHG